MMDPHAIGRQKMMTALRETWLAVEGTDIPKEWGRKAAATRRERKAQLDFGFASDSEYRAATITPDGLYRLDLWRGTGLPAGGYLNAIALNPSKADEKNDDLTTILLVGLARRVGVGRLCITNLYAWRDTDPAGLLSAAEPIGPDNDGVIIERAKGAAVVVICWGASLPDPVRARHVEQLLRGAGIALFCLGQTKTGHPRHPRGVPTKRPLSPWPGYLAAGAAIRGAA